MGFYESVKGYMQKRKYQRLNVSTGSKRRLRITKMGSRRRRIWRLKMVPRLKLRWINPKSVLLKLRGAYVNMMLYLANSGAFSTGMVGGGGNPFGQRSLKEFDNMMFAETCKAVMGQAQILRELQTSISS